MTAVQAIERIRKELGITRICSACPQSTYNGCKATNYPTICAILCSIEADEKVRNFKTRYGKEGAR